MTGIVLTRMSIAAALDSLRYEMAHADPALAQNVGCTTLQVLHTLLCCAEDGADPGWDAEAEAPAEDAPAEDAAAPPPEPDAAPPPASRMPAAAATQAPAMPEPEPAAPAPTGQSRLTPERSALFREIWPTALSAREVMDRLNALPGEPYTVPQAMYRVAKTLGLPTARSTPEDEASAEAPAPAAPPPVTFPPPHFRPPVAVPATPALYADLGLPADDVAEAEAAIRLAPHLWPGRKLADYYGWPIEKAAAFAQRVRAAMAAEKAAASEGPPA